MKYIMVATAALIFWCSSTHAQLTAVTPFDECPDRGTVVSDPYCGAGLGRWTKYEKVANGQCGTYRRVLEENAVECGYTPDEPVCPLKGTDLNIQYCGDPEGTYFTKGDPLNLYTRIANGTCGSWRRTLEENSEVCIPKEPEFSIEPMETSGDRFRPVMFKYTGPVDVEATLGKVEVTEDEIRIYGEGELGEGTLLVNGDEWRYTIQAEPRCTAAYKVDCVGYAYYGPNTGYIYYGENDTRMVEWELGIVHWLPVKDPEDPQSAYQIYEYWTEENKPEQWNRYQNQVDQYNEFYARSGIHVRFVLKTLAAGNYGVSESGHGLQSLARQMGVDIAIGNGRTCPNTCGCAFPRSVFLEGSTPVTGVSICGIATDLHELGHGMGLGHGPNNSANAGVGWIWEKFGHGDYAFCGSYDDIMSYGGDRMAHHNSLNTCISQYGDVRGFGVRVKEEEYDLPAGNRETADAAYHINRIRYDIALIHQSWMTEEPEEVVNDAPVILDLIDDFQNGRTLYNRGMQRHQSLTPQD